MIAAHHGVLADAVFKPYVTGLLGRDFRSLRVVGTEPSVPAGLPLIVIGNHNTWWDGFFIYLLNLRVFRRRLYLMMAERQLKRFPFFSHVGAFSVNPGHPRSVRESLSYAAGLLSLKDTLLCVFPQGVMTPYGASALVFRPGLEKIVTMYGGEVALVQVAIKCAFLEERKPEVFFLLDDPVISSAADFPGTRVFEERQAALVERLDRIVMGGRADMPGRTL